MRRSGWLWGLLFWAAFPGDSDAASARVGAGYSLYPEIGGLLSLRYSTYTFYIEGGGRIEDRADNTTVLIGSKMAVRPLELRGIPLEFGASLGIASDYSGNDTLMHTGLFAGLSDWVTDYISVGVGIYPVCVGTGIDPKLVQFLTPVFDIHFLF